MGEKDFHSLFENMREGVAHCSMVFEGGEPVDFVFLDANRAFYELTGLGDVAGKRISEVIPGIRESNSEMFRIYGRVSLTGKPERFETFVEGLDNWFAVSTYSPEKGHFVTIFDNITERRWAEESRTATVELLRICNRAENMAELLKEITSFFQRLTGCEAIGVRLKQGEDFPYYETRGFPGEFVLAENSLCAVDREGRIVRDSAGHPVIECMCGNVICGRFDPSKRFFSKSGSFWSNCTTELLAATTDADRQARTRNRCNGEGYESVALIPLRYRDETYGLVQFNDRRKDRFSEKKIALLEELVSHVAITIAKQKTDEAMRQFQKMEAIGQLAGGIAHDFNNILSAICGYTEMALSYDSSPELKEDLGTVLRASGRAAELVRQLLAFSRTDTEEAKPVQVRPLVEEAMGLLRATIPSTVEFRMHLRSGSRTVADPTEIHRIVVNLCTNASLAMRENGGVLTVELEDVAVDEAFASDHPGVSSGRFLRLTVRDTGCGMPEAVRLRIFEPFFTTRSKDAGTGMGLSVVHGIVKRRKGAISVSSEPGKGSTFQIFFPVEEEAAKPAGTAEISPMPGRERILFVDDEPMLASLVKKALKSMGYDVTTHDNGAEALADFLSRPDDFDLLITDMTMPAMTGDVLAREIRARRPSMPVILCTGYSERINEEKAREAGIDGFMMKPVAISQLSRAIRKVLDKT